ncbi:MAG TPA: LLM class flavin-dependent oxidoreductase [Acidimicrobiia bacterium]|nr:LLM class flavin-dependent oxidoreductase [Acidimicrobiia bacterium]
MEFGVQTRGDWAHVLRVARWAEERGLAAIALPDHYLQRGDDLSKPAWDHLVHLAALATETDLELVALVSPVTFRHPAVYYKMGVTIDEISGGRFTLGLGAGWLEEEFEAFGLPFPELGVRMEMLEEAAAYLRAAITPGAHGFEGSHYRLSSFDPHPQPTNLRLMMGGAGKPRSRRIAARYADEYNLYACAPGRYRIVWEKLRAEMEAVGRKPDEMFWTSAGPALAAKKESDYRRLLEHVVELTGQDPEHIEKVYEERSYPHGSGAKAAEMIAALEEAGCQRFYPQFFSADLADYDLVFDAYQAG